MPVVKSEASKESLCILHVLTLNGASGEYGGPNRVASELCKNLKQRGHRVQIFTGVQSNSVPAVNQDLEESYELVKPLSKYFPVSSLWSKKLPKRISRLVNEVDLVHIHFARDIIPVLTAFICIMKRKPFVTQTHGMVIQDKRLLTKVFDLMFTRIALKKSAINFVLSEQELTDVKSLHLKTRMELLPNGIEVSEETYKRLENKIPRIVFCSRLQVRKRADRFVNLARYSAQNDLLANFVIFGPDGGELSSIESEIKSDRYLSALKYKGALPPSEVREMLGESDLLVLPSENEPFPMIVLEALSVGTPVLIMPSCGLASLLKVDYPNMVAFEDNDAALLTAFKSVYDKRTSVESRKEIRNFCRDTFSIDKVTSILEFCYRSVASR
jgi:glycosyltransferase involved in cell wall biosynthesis